MITNRTIRALTRTNISRALFSSKPDSGLSSSEASDVDMSFRDVRTRIDPVKGEVTDFLKHVNMYEE
jgi:hypothetical protein